MLPEVLSYCLYANICIYTEVDDILSLKDLKFYILTAYSRPFFFWFNDIPVVGIAK